MESQKQTLKKYGRGIIGGLLFSLPLLYTMEVWWAGFIVSPEKLLACIFTTLLLLLGYNKFAGMRKDANLIDITRDSLEEIGLAFIVSASFLFLINKINFSMSFNEITGKVIIESMIVAIGISIGKSQLGQQSSKGESTSDKRDKKGTVQMLILGVCGAVVFASNVAPTEEIVELALVSSYWNLLLMIFVSVLLGFIIIVFSDFINSTQRKMKTREILLHVLIGNLTGLIVSIGFLWFFGRFDGSYPDVIISEIIVLLIPSSLGGSAGRLLIGAK
ncbi:MAG: TIGR02587 family membrane protein [Gillisia sp.]